MWQFVHIPKTGGLSFAKAYRDFPELESRHDTAGSRPADVRTVAVIRDPLERLLSVYTYSHQKIEGIQDWIDTGRWQEWPYCVCKRSPGKPTLLLASPQSCWLRPETHVMRFAHLQADVDAWADMAGYPRRQLEHRNRSCRGDVQPADVLRPDTIEMLREYYAADLEFLKGLDMALPGPDLPL